MKKTDFLDLRIIDATQWSREVDPIGLLAYQAWKRKKYNLDEAADFIRAVDVLTKIEYSHKTQTLTLVKRHYEKWPIYIKMSPNAANDLMSSENRSRWINQKIKQGKIVDGNEKNSYVLSEAAEDIEEKKISPQQRADQERVQYGAMKRDDYEKKWKVGKYRPKTNPLHGPGGLYKNLVKSAVKEDVEQLDEVLTLQQRMKRKILMRRLAPRIARARKIAMRRQAGLDVLKRRAKALARRRMARKLLGGKSKSDVSPSERARIEKILAKRKKGIERLAVRLLPIVRKQQSLRFANKNKARQTPPKKPTPAPTASAASSNK